MVNCTSMCTAAGLNVLVTRQNSCSWRELNPGHASPQSSHYSYWATPAPFNCVFMWPPHGATHVSLSTTTPTALIPWPVISVPCASGWEATSNIRQREASRHLASWLQNLNTDSSDAEIQTLVPWWHKCCNFGAWCVPSGTHVPYKQRSLKSFLASPYF